MDLDLLDDAFAAAGADPTRYDLIVVEPGERVRLIATSDGATVDLVNESDHENPDAWFVFDPLVGEPRRAEGTLADVATWSARWIAEGV